MFGGFMFFVILFVMAPIARAIARSIDRGRAPRDLEGSEAELRKALQQAELRLSDSETRLATLEERVDFYERLLANPTSSSKPEPPTHPS